MTVDELIRKYQLTVTCVADRTWQVDDVFSGWGNKTWPLVSAEKSRALAVRRAVAYLRYCEKYRFCTECKKRLTDEEYKHNRHRMETSWCGSEICHRKRIVRHYGCCSKASLYPCVCLYAFTCPKHGITHVGTHE